MFKYNVYISQFRMEYKITLSSPKLLVIRTICNTFVETAKYHLIQWTVITLFKEKHAVQKTKLACNVTDFAFTRNKTERYCVKKNTFLHALRVWHLCHAIMSPAWQGEYCVTDRLLMPNLLVTSHGLNVQNRSFLSEMAKVAFNVSVCCNIK